jgi:valyl-tRNA synthetase
VTGFDIIFFWVARMVMTGLHFMDEVPFHTVHLTGLVRDAEGQKMSKTRGNTVDPLELIDEYGADALRFTLAILDSPGRDIPLDPDRMAGYRSFGNKIWNATRFSLSRVGESRVETVVDPSNLAAPERWILSRLSRASREVNEKFGAYRFDEACSRLYHFFWGELCDWYIELSKPALSGESPRPEVGTVLLTALERSLRLLHPVMPFLTEELWQRLPGREQIHPETICLAPYPEPVGEWEDDDIEAKMDRFVQLVTWARNIRSELKVDRQVEVELFLEVDDAETRSFLEEMEELSRVLIRISSFHYQEPPATVPRDVVGGIRVGLLVPEKELTAEDRARAKKERDNLQKQIDHLKSLLADEQFINKAPKAVVDQNRQRLREMNERIERLSAGME